MVLKIKLHFFQIAVLLIFIFVIKNNDIIFGQPLSGTYNVGTGQTFTSLTGTGSAGFFNAVNTRGLSGNVTVLITSDISESGSVSLNQWAGSYTITIQPANASLKNLFGNVASPLFNINGADNLTIDGRFNGSGRYLRFVNSNSGGSTFNFVNDATNNTITYCRVDGMRVSATSGIIDFSTTTGSTGNDNNTISYCSIQDASGGTLQNAIVSNGTTSTSARYNSNITITENEIINVFRNGQVCSAILLLNGSTDFNITNNHIYQTAVFTPSNATNWYMIYVNTSVANNINISGNYIGGTAINCGGSPFTISGTQSNTFYFIRFQAVGTTAASNIDGNVLGNFSMTTNPSAAGAAYFAGITTEAGLVNVGANTGNIIGNNTSTGNITITINGTTDNIITRGIHHASIGDIKNNIIGSISLNGNNNRTVRFEGIWYTGAPSSSINIQNNTIGSLSAANSIQQTSGSYSCQLTGIHTQINSVLVTINQNKVSNLRIINNSASSRIRGIYQARSTTAPISVTNNVIANLYSSSSASADANRYPDNTGLVGLFTGSSSTNQYIAGNSIYGLYGTDNSNSYVMGFAFYNNVAKGTFENNKIYNLNHSSTTGNPKIWGINAFWGSWSFNNNQISITNGELSDNYLPPVNSNSAINNNDNFKEKNSNTDRGDDLSNLNIKDEPLNKIDRDKGIIETNTDLLTNGVEIKGIHDEAEFPCSYYYNSVYIGGNAITGSANSWAYDRPLLAWATNAVLRNNIFFNGRTGGTGNHYAIGNEVGRTNWTNTSSDYNVYISPNSSSVAIWGALNQNIYQWRDSSFGDKHTWSTTSSDVTGTSLFNNVSSGDLSINTANWQAWIVAGKGIAISGLSADYYGNPRSSSVSNGCTDIGSHEFNAVPPSNPIANVDNPPGSGVTSTYTLWSRKIAIINWGTGGSSYPSSINVRYYSGENPPGVLGGGYSNSYWDFNPVGSFSGTTYSITICFGQNETYTITSPSVNSRLAKFNSTWEVFSTMGTGNWQSELDWTNEQIKTRGMYNFSQYALTDASNPLPVELCSFTASITNRNVALNWITCSEINNKGFDIERREYSNVNSQFSAWQKIGFIEGKGTTNQQQYYSFNDNKLSTGKYQYRLKQIDYNNNFEYFNLTSPENVIIGIPQNAELYQNYPNPSNPVSKVDFQIPFSGNVILKVYDITGKEVMSLINSYLEAGYYTVQFNGSNLSSGVYFYRITANSTDGNNFTKTMKMMLIK
jgi:hypothetical protein